MTGGVNVSWYPRPMYERQTWFLAARRRSSASTSASERAGGKSSGRLSRMSGGTIASVKASSEA